MKAPIEPQRAPQRRANSSSVWNTAGNQVSRSAPSICTISQSRIKSGMLAGSVAGEEGHRRRVIVGASLGGGVDDGEDSLAPAGHRKGLIVDEQLFSAEEGDARPVDELGQIFLGVDQRVVVPSDRRETAPGAAASPLGSRPRALGKKRIVERGRMKFGEPVLGSVQIL